MKNMKRTIPILALALAVAGCLEPSHINDNLYDPAVYFLNSGYQQTETIYDLQDYFTYPVNVYCGGFNGSNSTVKVRVDENALASYNSANGTDYIMLPDDCFTFEGGEKNLSGKKVSYDIVFNCAKLVQLCSEGGFSVLSKYVVPLTVSSISGEVNTGRVSLTETFISPVMGKMGFKVNYSGDKEMSISEMEEDNDFIYVKYKVFTPVENKWDCPVFFSFNEPAVGLPYAQLPAGSYSVSASSDGFKPGISEVVYTVKIDKSKTPDVYYSLVAEVRSGGEFVCLTDGRSNISLLNRKKYSQSSMTIESFNSGESASSASYILDGDPETHWHCAYKSGQYGEFGAVNFEIVVRLNEEISVSAFSILRRSGTYATDLKAGYIEVSRDGKDFAKACDFYFGTASDFPEPGPLFVVCDPVKAKYVKIVCTDCNRYSSGTNRLANIAEFNVFYK